MIRNVVFLLLLLHSAFAQKPALAPPTWLTLSGNRPKVVARGGFSGLLPESSGFANQMAVSTGLSDTVVWCSLQLTKDGVGICLPDVRIDNSTSIASVFPKRQKTFNVNGVDTRGWFALDFTSDELLTDVTLTQNIYSRSNLFDGQLPISTVEDVMGVKPPELWLSVPYDAFYTQNKLSPATYIAQTGKHVSINYVSSPEIAFLKAIGGKVDRAKTKRIFQFLGPDQIEPTTNSKYSSILQDLPTVKSFATGILVPKEYIWPVDSEGYLGKPTTLVADAHKLGLEVYAAGFANDVPASYNYSYDPTSEYIQFVDNSQFSVDGVVTDFPPTASEAIACFAHNNNGGTPRKGSALIISNNGASGVYPGCTDLAYQQAVDDGADIIDCSVQLSKDGVAFCLASADLAGDTTAMMPFIDRKETVPEIQPETGVFSFSLSWSEIQTLQPQMVSPFGNSSIERNPANKNAGKFLTLAEFLQFAKAKPVSGILINIENAAYLASKQGLDLVGTVRSALANATLDQQSTPQVLIQSDDTSVLDKFAGVGAYKRVFRVKEKIGSAAKPAVEEIKKHADAVTVPRSAVMKVNEYFTVGLTEVVKELKAAKLSVYVHELRNEYVTLAFDYFSDPIIEIATYVLVVEVDGIITDYPATAAKYMRSTCTDPKVNASYPILPAEPGSLLGLIPPEIQPPAQAPEPSLEADDVADPPLPPVAKIDPADGPVDGPADAKKSAALAPAVNAGLSVLAIIALSLLSLSC